MDSVTILDKTFVKFIPGEEIDAAIQKVADQINEEYKNDDPVLLVTLNGAIVFAVDLLKRLTIQCRISCVKLSSYSGTQSTNVVKNLIGLTEDLRGKRVIILEDIIDTGRTYKHLVEMLEPTGLKDLRIATMTYKPEAYMLDLPIHYCAFSIPNKFVVGRGLDYDGYAEGLKGFLDAVAYLDGQPLLYLQAAGVGLQGAGVERAGPGGVLLLGEEAPRMARHVRQK